MSASNPTRSVDSLVQMRSKIFRDGHTGYSEWSKDYDADTTLCDYRGPSFTARDLDVALGGKGHQKDLRILDVCAGTGFVGDELRRLGYNNIDAIDANAEMLELARKKNIYKNIHCQLISRNPTPGFDEDAYDALIAVGSFYPGALLPDVFHEFLRVVKKGGLIAVGMDAEYASPYTPDEFNALFQEMETDGKLHVKQRKEYDVYVLQERGVAFVLEVL